MPDLYCDITYNLKKDSFKVSTNLRPGLVEEFIADWVIRGQMGKGADDSRPNKKNVYHIRITCDMSYDEVTISSDTGNKGLTCGIIAHALAKGEFKPSKLEEAVQIPSGSIVNFESSGTLNLSPEAVKKCLPAK